MYYVRKNEANDARQIKWACCRTEALSVAQMSSAACVVMLMLTMSCAEIVKYKRLRLEVCGRVTGKCFDSRGALFKVGLHLFSCFSTIYLRV